MDKYLIQHRKDASRQQEVTEEVWNQMSARGDARHWRKVRTVAGPPKEIKAAMEKVVEKKRAEKAELPEKPIEEEQTTE